MPRAPGRATLGWMDRIARTVGVLLLALAVLPATAPASAHSTCLRPGYKVIHATDRGGIFRTAAGIRKHRDGYYACLYRYGIRVRLGGDGPPKHFGFGGNYFARSGPTGTYPEGGGPTPAGIMMYDLSRTRRARRYVFTIPSGWPGTMNALLPPASLIQGDPVTDMAVTARGGLAWIAKPLPGSADYQVLAATGHGFRRTARLLDSGPGVAPRSLHRHGRSGVRWTRDGSVHSAGRPLPELVRALTAEARWRAAGGSPATWRAADVHSWPAPRSRRGSPAAAPARPTPSCPGRRISAAAARV